MASFQSTGFFLSVAALAAACSLINAPEDLKPSAAGASGMSGSGASGANAAGKGGAAPQAGSSADAGQSSAGENNAGSAGEGGEAGTGPGGPMCAVSAADCSGTAPICDATEHACRACGGDPECAAIPGASFCAATGRCIECKKNTDCTGASPVCGPAGNCRGCTENSECSSGVCNAQTGNCAAPASAVYVLAGTGSTQATCGSFEEPCRFAATAVAKLTAARPNLVLLATQQVLDSGGAIIPALNGVRVIGNGVVIRPYDGATAFTVTGGSVGFDGIDLRGSKTAEHPALSCSGGTVIVRNSHFQSNDVAISATDCDLTISDSVLEKNATPLANGFVAINAACTSANCSKTLTVERSLIEGNGKALYTTIGNTVLRNSEWLNNGDASSSGAYNRVLEFRGKTVSVAYNTFVGNFNGCSYVGILACNDGTCDALGNITWNNFPGQSCADQVMYGFQKMTYNLNEALQPGAGNKSADPKFVNAPNGDFTPSRGSPAIDNGSPTGAPSDDFNGKPRPVGDGPDMGAIEVQ